MSKEILGILKQIRSGKSSLTAEDTFQLEPDLYAIDTFLVTGIITEEELLALSERMKQHSQELADTWYSQQEDPDISTRMTNIAGWELASLLALVCTHHIFVTTKSKQFSSST